MRTSAPAGADRVPGVPAARSVRCRATGPAAPVPLPIQPLQTTASSASLATLAFAHSCPKMTADSLASRSDEPAGGRQRAGLVSSCIPMLDARGSALYALLLPVALTAQPVAIRSRRRRPSPSECDRRAGTLQGKRGWSRWQRMQPADRRPTCRHHDLEFGDGVIEAEIAGDVQPAARGCPGIRRPRLSGPKRPPRSTRSTCARPTGGRTIRCAGTTPRNRIPTGRGRSFARSSRTRTCVESHRARGRRCASRCRAKRRRRARREAADAGRQRRQDRTARQRRRCALDRRRNRRALPEPLVRIAGRLLAGSW